jgi:hypothetical protein
MLSRLDCNTSADFSSEGPAGDCARHDVEVDTVLVAVRDVDAIGERKARIAKDMMVKVLLLPTNWQSEGNH